MLVVVVYSGYNERTSMQRNTFQLDLTSHSATQTWRWGEQLGQLARAGDLVCLEGDLGSGKTCFTQGLGHGLGVREEISSPTFILANEHRGGRLRLYHLDVYRLRNPDEAIGIGLDDYLAGDGVTVIEWAEKIRAVLPTEHLWITFRHIGEDERALQFQATGARYIEWLSEFAKHVTSD